MDQNSVVICMQYMEAYVEYYTSIYMVHVQAAVWISGIGHSRWVLDWVLAGRRGVWKLVANRTPDPLSLLSYFFF